jgi:S-adenosylmethionine hydrolase
LAGGTWGERILKILCIWVEMDIFDPKNNVMKSKLFSLILAMITIFLIAGAISCTKDDSVVPDKGMTDLVIVTDNDPGSYMMVKILGEVRSNYPDVNITFIESKQFDIYEGAFLLNTAFQSFPEGTAVAGIVEPGAGNQRIVFELDARRVIAPDNTLATWILYNNPDVACIYVENSSVLGDNNPEELSFEEFYAEAICSLLSGTPTSQFGSVCMNPELFQVQEPVMSGDIIYGQIAFTDNFGNCITNIPESLFSGLPVGTIFTLQSDTLPVGIELGITYSSVPVGENVCFINSSDFLELAINYGNFSETWGVSAGTIIHLQK